MLPDAPGLARDRVERTRLRRQCVAIPRGSGPFSKAQVAGSSQRETEDLIASYTVQAAREGTTVKALMKAADEKTLLNHVMTASDVANVVAFLCSPLAIGIHGEAIAVDGGNRADMHY